MAATAGVGIPPRSYLAVNEVPTVPFPVLPPMAGAIPTSAAGMIVISSDTVVEPSAFVAVIVNVDVPSVVGCPSRGRCRDAQARPGVRRPLRRRSLRGSR